MDDSALVVLDGLENVPTHYQKLTIDIELQTEKNPSGGTHIISCTVYGLKDVKAEMLEKTLYANYSSQGDHGCPFLGPRSNIQGPDYSYEG